MEIADRVLVMEDGRIVEDGSPAELVTGSGRFAGLHRAWAEARSGGNRPPSWVVDRA